MPDFIGHTSGQAEIIRKNHRELTQKQQNEIEIVKSAAQLIVDRTAVMYGDLCEEGQAKLATGTMHLETAVMWLVKGMSAEVQPND